MDNQKQYKIYEVLAAAASYLDNPEDKELSAKFEEIKNGLIVREYMPIAQKELCIKKTLIDMRVDENTKATPYTASVLYEIALVFDCLLGYVVNLDYDIDGIYKDATFYDILAVSGLTKYILSFCKEDYSRLEQMANRMISFDNLKELSKNLELASPEQVARLTTEFKNFITDLNPEVLARLGGIAAADDPLLTNIKNIVEDTTFKAIDESTNN